jgi:acetoin utilization deacetylase AcuC-like enzyme
VSNAEQHDKPGHPEASARITAIEQALSRSTIQNQVQFVSGKGIPQQAVMHLLELVHPPGYLQRVQEICNSLQVRPAACITTHTHQGALHQSASAAATAVDVES